MNEVERGLVQKIHATVTRRLAGQGAGHGMDHVLRVLNTARQIQSEVGGELFIVELAALLHDVGDAKFHDGIEMSATYTKEILEDLGVSHEVIDAVVTIVDNISYRKGIDADLLSLEGKIVQDADRIDALGAIGIVRTIEFGATRGQPFHVVSPTDAAPNEKVSVSDLALQKTGVGHFYDKLFKLRKLLNTEPAKQIALQRERFMQSFLDQYFLESSQPLAPTIAND